MLTRVGAMMTVNPRGMWIGTFHGLCNRMLRAHAREAGLPQAFQILDSQDQLAAIKRLLKGMNVDEERFPPREVQYFINGQKEEGVRAARRAARRREHAALRRALRRLRRAVPARGRAGFPELLLRSYELLSRNEILREHYASRFRHILVDEFQDTNRLQYRWLKLIGGRTSVFFAVGDDDQSIYTFRGANVGNMADFEREFKVAQVIRLEQNYRSHGNILDAANALIANNRNRLGKNLWTAAGKGEPVRVFEGESDNDEARWIVEEVQALARDGTRLSQMAVLYRSNAQSRVRRARAVLAGHSLPRLRRPALLRARRDQARARLPAPHRHARRRQRLPARRQLPAARHRRAHRRAAAGRGEAGAALSLHEGCGRLEGRAVPSPDRKPQKRDPGPAAEGDGRGGDREERPGRALQDRARRRRPHREPGGAGERRGRVHRGGPRDRVGRGGRSAHRVPHPRRARGGRAPGGRGAGRAADDDGALGQGPGVRRRCS